jgi:putative zinc finger/helix-turn-helix YgiT family protein
MAKDACKSCGKKVKTKRGNYRYDQIGAPVLLKRVQIAECAACGTREPALRDRKRLMDTIAFAVASQPWKLRGADVRFLRKYCGMTGGAFGKLVQVEPETLSRWENDQQDIGKNSDRLIRFVVVSKSPELRKNMLLFLERYRQLTDKGAPRTAHIAIDPATMKYDYA